MGLPENWAQELQDKIGALVGPVYDILCHEPGYADLALNYDEVAL